MKGSITQYVVLGVMLLVIVLIVSLYPAQHRTEVSSQMVSPANVSKLSIRAKSVMTRAD